MHQGLFRSVAKNQIKTTTRIYENWVETEYHGEPLPTGILARLLGAQSNAPEAQLQHWDRFYAPGVVQVEYKLGSGSHFQITAFCTPQTTGSLAVFASASFKTPLPDKILALLLEPVARLVLAQDLRILRAQQANIELFGSERYTSTPLDLMGAPIWRILRKSLKLEASGLSSQPEASTYSKKVENQPLKVLNSKLIA